MKICISTLPPNGRLINDELSVIALNNRLGREDIQFVSSPVISGRVDRQPDGAFLQAIVRAHYNQQCGNSGEFHPRIAEEKIAIALRPSTSSNQISDDTSITYYDNDIVDIEVIAQEFLILSLDLWWRSDS